MKGLHLEDRPGGGGLDASKDAAARLGYNVYVGQLARLTVKRAQPHNVVWMSPAVKEVMGFTECEVVGRSLRVMQGPLTNVGKLEMLLEAAGKGKSSETAFALYTNKGEERIVTIDLQPDQQDASGSGEVENIILTMEHGDWVPKKIADAEDGRAKLTLLADKPWSVQQVSPSFLEMYSLKEEMIMGRTLNVVFGPRTDASMFRLLLLGARAAKTQHVDMWTCKPNDMSHVYVHVTIFPVVDKGEVTHFMVVFKHDESAGSPESQSPRRNRQASPLAAVARSLTISDPAPHPQSGVEKQGGTGASAGAGEA